MSMNRIISLIRNEEKEFITTDEIKPYSKRFYYNSNNVINYLLGQGDIIKILNDLYYIKSNNEIESKIHKYSLLEIVSKALSLRKIVNWYFGLYTALKLNNISTDHDNDLFYVFNDMFFRNEPINIAGYPFKFFKFRIASHSFGIRTNKVNYSDLERTILDFIYIQMNNRIHEQRIINFISKYMKGISIEKILSYAQYYPEQLINILQLAISNTK